MLDEIHSEPAFNAQIAGVGWPLRRTVDSNDPVALGLDLDRAAGAAEAAHAVRFLAIRLGLQAGIGQVLDRACGAHADTLAAIVALGVTEVRGAAYERWIALSAGGVDVAVLHGAANTQP